MSKVLVKKPEVNMKEEQSLMQAQDMILSVISSIAYIRDLFSEDAFEDTKVAGMQTKRLKKHPDSQTAQLLEWIEQGCFDALKKKYLQSLVFGIFDDINNPNVMLETYTLTIDYPSSAAHQSLSGAVQGVPDVGMRLTLKKDGSEKLLSSSTSFQKEIVSVLRSLCVLTQTLGPLPSKRYLTMQITYYDELTPRDYEPPGFTPVEFDINHIFNQPTMKHTFGKASSDRIGLSMETNCTDCDEMEEKSEAMVPGTLHKPAVPSDQDMTQTPNIAAETQPTLVKTIADIDIESQAKAVDQTQVVRCACEDTETDLDMIQCDFCGCWQHTPCVGFCSNRDKRIPKDNYKCYTCRFGQTKKIMTYLKDLSCFRRVVAILFTDGIKSITELAQRLSCGIKKASNLIQRAEDEGLLRRGTKGSGFVFTPCSGQAVKDKLNHYFGPDPELLADFPDSETGKRKAPTHPAESAFAIKPIVSSKRRKSEVTLKISSK